MASLKDLLVSGAAKLLSTLRVSGDTHIDGTLYLNGAIGGAKQPVYVDSTGKFVAGTSLSNVTNYDQSVAIKEITRTANATTYTLKTIAGATSTVTTPVATGTANRLAIYTDAYNIGQSTISFASETLTVPGAVVPFTTNARTLGTSSSRWSKLYLGTADSYGSTYVPIYWNAGVPTAVTANNMLTDLGSTTGVNVFQQNPRPGVTGTLGVGNGGTGKTSWTQWGVLYASASNTLVNTAAGTTGKYLGAITNGAPTWKDILANEIHPSISKTYTPTESYGTADSDAACSFYFISVKPDSWYKPWQIRFRVRSYCASHTNADSVTWTTLNGRADSMIYHNWNERYDIGHYYIAAHILKSAGFNAGLGHAVGISVRYATGRGNTEYNRTIELDYYDCYGCTVTVLDSATKWSGWTNGTDTNYNGYSNYNAVDRGLQESGDANSTSISHWYQQYGGFVAGNNIKRYQFVFQQLSPNQNKLITLFETDNAYGTTNKTLLTTEFDPLGLMFYYNSSGTNASASNIDPGRLYNTSISDLRYTFNVTSTASDTTFTGVRYTPLYLRVNINPATGGASVDGNQPLVTILPTAADGKHYIYLGQVHNWYQVYFTAEHPVYYHDGTRICRYYGNSNHLNIMVNGGLEIRGHIAGDSSDTTGHGLYSGGGYHNAYNSIILHGDASTGSSGIAFVSDKVTNGKTIANVNAPSDRAFIQYHACGVSTYTAEGTAPTLATSGEAGKLIIGVGNDAGDQIHLQAPSHVDLLHRIGASAYVIPDTNNTSGTVGGTTQPVYVSSGIITAANTYAGGTAVTLNNTSKASSTASFYAPTSGGTQNTQALVGDGATAAPKWVNISPSITITAGTSSATPKVNVTVLGQSGTAQSITTATTSAYGATKLTNVYTSTDESLAATGKSILAAIQTLDVSAVGVVAATGNRYICQISETDGKISATLATATIGSASQPVWINGGTITALTGTIANNISGNAATATAFSSNATVTLTGDTTGTSAGSTKSWSIATTTTKLSQTTTTALSSFTDSVALIYTAAGGSNTITDKPTSVDAFGCLSFKTASGWYGQLLMSSNTATGLYWRTATSLSGGWKKILDDTNYTDYTVKKDGTGASGTWGISISGNAATATKVYVTNTTPASTTTYYLTYTDSTTSGNQNLRNSSRLYFYDTGTTGYLVIGNSSNSGGLTLRNANRKYGDIVTSAFTANRTFTLPDATGTIALTSSSITGNAATATSANLTTNTNAVAIYTNTTGKFGQVRAANGAFYSTGQDVAPKFGTLPVGNGGTGVASFTANSIIISGSTTTSALTTGPVLSAAITSQTTSTKFLREDGTFAIPSYTTSLALSAITGADDLKAIEALTGTSGLLKKTAANTWTLDTTTYLSSHQTIKQDGLTGATINRYGACSIAAGTAAKTVSVTSGTVPTLDSNAAGLKVTVKFTNANTADNPTLNVNSKGAKNIFHRGTQITTGSNKALLAGVCDFVFDGTQWHLIGNYTDYSLPLAANGTRGGIQIGYSESGTNYAVKLSSEKAYVTVPWTDTKVTSAANHYTPSADSNSQLTASISGTAGTFAANTEYTVLTGVQVQRDAKGHVTGVTYTAQKIKGTNTVNNGTANSIAYYSTATTISSGATFTSAISTQTYNTKFLREDGTWAVPSYVEIIRL